jgi:hypothetical protein
LKFRFLPGHFLGALRSESSSSFFGFSSLVACFCVFLVIVFFAGSARHEPLSNQTQMPPLQQVVSS